MDEVNKLKTIKRIFELKTELIKIMIEQNQKQNLTHRQQEEKEIIDNIKTLQELIK